MDSVEKARWAHNLFILNLFFIHLLATPGIILLGIGLWGLLIPLSLSLILIAWTYYRYRSSADLFVRAHWQLAWHRYRLLMIGYAATAAILLITELWVRHMADQNMAQIMLTVMTRIAIMPTLIMVMITIVLEAAAAGRAAQGLPAKS